ncbi:MAG: NAD-dependent epimerase/dehydratase family protein [Planctomycetota bacterium]|nr:NAD-dependent epimerase/dehydratase family protein [Planctomycetota bacterium]
MKYLVTGGAGNIACQFSKRLPRDAEVLLTDIAKAPFSAIGDNATYQRLNVTQRAEIDEMVGRERPDVILHFASLLSGQSEADRNSAWEVNMQGAFNIFEAALKFGVERVVFLSSIASFGSPLPDPVPEECEQWPRGFYGFTKAAVERLGFYYKETLGLDFRSIRLPIVISPYPSSGAASSYASDVFIAAVRDGGYTLQVRESANPAVLYIEDCLKAIDLLTHASAASLSRASYNLFSCAPTAGEIVTEIQKRVPEVKIDFVLDEQVADLIDSWPRQIDDQAARTDWDWCPDFGLSEIADDFLFRLKQMTKGEVQ